jgi:hypothetical protein
MAAWMNGFSQENPFTTFGKFQFKGVLSMPEYASPSPVQYAKFENALIGGITFDDGDTLFTDMYLLPLAGKSSHEGAVRQLHIPRNNVYNQYLQGSSSASGQTIVFTANDYSGWSGNQLAMTTLDETGKYGVPQLLNGLNSDGISECYPWISHDGLRLYFVKDEVICLSTRNNQQELFTTFEQLPFTVGMELPVLSIWLDESEKNLWIVTDNIIYRSSRKKTKKPFDMPVIFTEEFKDFSFISSISFTPDGKEMFLYFSDEEDLILHYQMK